MASIPPTAVLDLLSSFRHNTHYSEYNCFMYHKKIARALLMDKHLVYIGDSLTRAMYKDMISLITNGSLAFPNELRAPNETSFMNDRQIDILPLEENRVFRQAREFSSSHHLIQYFFTSRAMREDLEKPFLMMKEKKEIPDIIVMNSTIWDVSRYYTPEEIHSRNVRHEVETIDEYVNRVTMVCRRAKLLLEPGGMFIWVLMPLVTSSLKTNGFMKTNRMTFEEIRIRQLEANVRAASVVKEFGFDVLDLSFHFLSSNFEYLRISDGVHWNNVGVRFKNQLLLAHLVASRDIYDEVKKKFRYPIKKALEVSNPNLFLDKAMTFLKSMQFDQSLCIRMEKEVRLKALEKFEELEGCNSIINLIESLKTMLAFERINRNYQKISIDSRLIRNVGAAPKHTEEEYEQMMLSINSIREKWKVKSKGQSLIVKKNILKRPHREDVRSMSPSISPELDDMDISNGDGDEYEDDDDVIYINHEAADNNRAKFIQPAVLFSQPPPPF